MLFIAGVVIVLIAVVIILKMRVRGSGNSANLGWMGEQWLAEHRAFARTVRVPVELCSRGSLESRRYKMALVFHRRLAIPLWAIAFVTVALTAPTPAPQFLMPPTTLFVIAVCGIAIIFTMPRVVACGSLSRRCIPSRRRHKTSVAITMAGGTCVRTLDEPNESTADDTLDLARMDDDGGWQIARPPA